MLNQMLKPFKRALRCWTTVLNFVQDRYVYTAISGSAVPKNRQYGAKRFGCSVEFLVRVNGVLVLHQNFIIDTTGVDQGGSDVFKWQEKNLTRCWLILFRDTLVNAITERNSLY